MSKTLNTLRMRTGFTLIELMIVITIIGILSTVGMVGFRNARKNSKIRLARADLLKIRKSIESYKDINRKVITDDQYITNTDLMKILMTPNKKGFTALENINRTRFNPAGEYLDPWEEPYIFKTIGRRMNNLYIVQDVYVFSSGPDMEQAVSISGEWEEGVVLPPIEMIPDIDKDNVYPSE